MDVQSQRGASPVFSRIWKREKNGIIQYTPKRAFALESALSRMSPLPGKLTSLPKERTPAPISSRDLQRTRAHTCHSKTPRQTTLRKEPKQTQLKRISTLDDAQKRGEFRITRRSLAAAICVHEHLHGCRGRDHDALEEVGVLPKVHIPREGIKNPPPREEEKRAPNKALSQRPLG